MEQTVRKIIARREILSLCQDFAEELVSDEVHVYLDDDSGFCALAPTADSDECYVIGIKLEEEDPAIVANHLRLEKKFYGDVDYGFDYFTMSVLHEIGHLLTLRNFDSWELFDALDRHVDGNHGLEDYKLLPHEAAADQWSLLHFIPNNWEKVADFNTKIVSLLSIVRSGVE